MASTQTKGEGASWASNMYSPTDGHLSFSPNMLWINLRQSLCFFELAEVLRVRVNAESEEGKRKDWLLLRGVGEAAAQDRIAGQTPRSTSLSLHIEEIGLGPWPERKC